jgi:hypothetical protein
VRAGYTEHAFLFPSLSSVPAKPRTLLIFEVLLRSDVKSGRFSFSGPFAFGLGIIFRQRCSAKAVDRDSDLLKHLRPGAARFGVQAIRGGRAPGRRSVGHR